MAGSPAALIHPSRIPNRWVQLIAGIVAMMAIANLQYAWTLFTKPIQAHLHVSLDAVQWTFTFSLPWKPGWCRLKDFWSIGSGPGSCWASVRFMVGLGWIGSGLCREHR